MRVWWKSLRRNSFVAEFKNQFIMFLKKLIQKKIRNSEKAWFRFTKKSNKDAKYYVPTDVGKEIYFYNTYPLTDKEEILTSHVWSKAFRMWLIEKEKNFTLVEDVSTSDESNAILMNGECPVDLVIKAIKKVTPSKETAEKFLRSNSSRVYHVALNGYKAFIYSHAGYEAWLYKANDTKEHVVLEVATRAMNEDQGAWVKSLLDWAFEKQGRVSANMVFYLVNIALKFKMAFPVKGLEILKQDFYLVYSNLRENIFGFSNWEELLGTSLRQLQIGEGFKDKDITKVDVTSESDDPSDDAVIWLAQAFKVIDKSRTTREELMKILSKIKKFNKPMATAISEKIAEVVSGEAEVAEALRYLDVPYHAPIIWHTKKWQMLKEYYPFTGWEEAYKRQAIAYIIDNHELASERLQDLEGKLREYAIEEMETIAEIDVVELGEIEDLVKLVSSKLKRERVELAFLRMLAGGLDGKRRTSNSHIYAEIASIGDKYLEKYEVSANGFKVLMNFRVPEKTIRDYVASHGLTREQYELLLGHKWLNRLAPTMRDKIKEEEKDNK